MDKAPATAVGCPVCPHHCRLAPGQSGRCHIRRNEGGVLRLVVDRHPCALHVDPMEKKPFYHVLPGAPILSVGTPGCNLRCAACQNASISQTADPGDLMTLTPGALVATAQAQQSAWIAYTYTEPLVAYEYLRDCAIAAHAAGLRNAIITAAYINPPPLRALLPLIDAANVDLKAFSNDFYRRVCGATLPPVLRALRIMRDAGIHLEITHLVIPGLNDAEPQTRLLAQWIVRRLGPDIPLHISRFFPAWRLRDLPPTPVATLLRAADIAREEGLRYVYPGNLSADEQTTTHCPGCHAPLIIRRGWHVLENHLRGGTCPVCATEIYGIWK